MEMARCFSSNWLSASTGESFGQMGPGELSGVPALGNGLSSNTTYKYEAFRFLTALRGSSRLRSTKGDAALLCPKQ